MHQNLLNAEIASGAYRNARDKNMYVFGVMKALTKMLNKSFCCTLVLTIKQISCGQLRKPHNALLKSKAFHYTDNHCCIPDFPDTFLDCELEQNFFHGRGLPDKIEEAL